MYLCSSLLFLQFVIYFVLICITGNRFSVKTTCQKLYANTCLFSETETEECLLLNFLSYSLQCMQGVTPTHSYEIVQPSADPLCSPYDASNYRSSAAPLPNIQGTSGSSVYGTHMLLPARRLEDEEIPRISRSCLLFLEKLGAGECGCLYLLSNFSLFPCR